MSDRRFWRANDRVAHVDLAGQAPGELVEPVSRQISVPLVDLCRTPAVGRDKQLVYGQRFEVLETVNDFAFGYDPRDGYVGYIPAQHLSAPITSTHGVTANLAHIYQAPDFKSADLHVLPMGAELRIAAEEDGYLRLTDGGFVVAQHVAPLAEVAPDWVAIAERFEHAPYLWGGTTALGIDCSGLVQLSMHAAGRECPRDSDLQEAAFAPAVGDPRRGDLIFWKGHVGLMLDGKTLLHANAHHMAVAREPLASAIERIGEREFGAVTKIARP